MNHTKKQLEDNLEEFDKRFKDDFAIVSLRCNKCGHTKDSHYWNGGGFQECAGYDTCKVDGCGCVDYDENTDFTEVIDGYSKAFEYLKSHLFSSQTKTIVAIIEDIGKMRVYDLEEYSHEEKVENVGFNKALDRIQSNLKELLVGVK
jgi:ssDNA-binding Zn-finger/Zn-ribbon topoisomerase 1